MSLESQVNDTPHAKIFAQTKNGQKLMEGLRRSTGNVRMGLRVKGGCAVRGPDYLRALFKACQDLGDVSWTRMRVVRRWPSSM
jgi:hypothetical protein